MSQEVSSHKNEMLVGELDIELDFFKFPRF